MSIDLPLKSQSRTLLSYLLFTLTALIILTYPAGHISWVLQHGFSKAANLIAWLVCIVSLFALHRLHTADRNTSHSLTNQLLSLFLLLFALERAISFALPQGQVSWLTHTLPIPELLDTIAVALGAAVCIPRLRSAARCSAVAREEHAKFLAAAESSMDDFYIFDGVPDDSGAIVDFRFNYVNPNAERRLNTRRELLIGKILTQVRPYMLVSGLIENYREVVRTGLPFTAEIFIDDDTIKATWINVQVVKLGTGIAITSRDVTERKRLVDHISYLAHYDQLTGLANRTLLYDRLEQAIHHAQSHQQKLAIFMLDIDHFKHINDSLGHAYGDALLSAVGKRLLSAVQDTSTVARLGGDEFVILIPNVTGLADVTRRAQQIVQTTSRLPISLGSREVSITISSGFCIYPDCGIDAKELLKKADAAMYLVKQNGRDGIQPTPELIAPDAESIHQWNNISPL